MVRSMSRCRATGGVRRLRRTSLRRRRGGFLGPLMALAPALAPLAMQGISKLGKMMGLGRSGGRLLPRSHYARVRKSM